LTIGEAPFLIHTSLKKFPGLVNMFLTHTWIISKIPSCSALFIFSIKATDKGRKVVLLKELHLSIKMASAVTRKILPKER